MIHQRLIFLPLLLSLLLSSIALQCSIMHSSREEMILREKGFKAFRSSKKVEVVISQEIGKKETLPFTQTMKRLLSYAGFESEKDSADMTARTQLSTHKTLPRVEEISSERTTYTRPPQAADRDTIPGDIFLPILKITAEGHTYGATYHKYELGNIAPGTNMYVNDVGLLLRGTISAEISDEPFYEKIFSYEKTPPANILYRTGGGLKFGEDVLYGENSFIERAIEIAGDLFGNDFLVNAALLDDNDIISGFSTDRLEEIDPNWIQWESIKRFVPIFLADLGHKNHKKREIAARDLGIIREKGSLDSLIIILGHDEQSGVRGEAAKALGRIKDILAVPHLLSALNDNDSYVRNCALGALGKIKDPCSIISLIDITKKGEDASAAGEALKNITKKEFGSNYYNWMKWWWHSDVVKEPCSATLLSTLRTTTPVELTKLFIMYDGPDVLIDPDLTVTKRKFWDEIQNMLLSKIELKTLRKLDIKNALLVDHSDNTATVKIEGEYEASTPIGDSGWNVGTSNFGLQVSLIKYGSEWYVRNVR